MKPLFDQLAAVQRELELRRRVYPKWITSGRLTEAKAQHETECFEAVVATIQKLLWIQEAADDQAGKPTQSILADPTADQRREQEAAIRRGYGRSYRGGD